MQRTTLKLIRVRDLSGLSHEAYAHALKEAHAIGKQDGALKPPIVDPAIKDPDLDEDVVRAYLRGWEQGAGPLEETT